MPTRSINALLLFARRAIAPLPSLTGSTSYRDPPTSLLQVPEATTFRRHFASAGNGPRYRNRTSHFQRETDKTPSDAVTSGEIDEQSPTVSFAPEELVPGRPMLERIVRDLGEGGNTFILPTHQEAIDEVLAPFRQLENIGVKPVFLIQGCITHPELFKLLVTRSKETLATLATLVESGQVTYEDALRLISSYPEIVAHGAELVQLALDALITCGVTAGRQLGSLIKRCPPLLFARPAEEMRKTAEALGSFFTRKQIAMVVRCCPQVLLKSIQETEEKYEYIFYQMGLEGEEFTNCAKWGSLSLEDIIQRHKFLVKCGRFRTPDPRHPQFQMENPHLRNILDSYDDYFATQVALVTHEEWVIYRALCAKEAEMATKEHPFVRVKPSMRKAYERRRKEAADSPAHVFDAIFQFPASGGTGNEKTLDTKDYMHRMYPDFFDVLNGPLGVQHQLPPNAAGPTANEPPFPMGSSSLEMSIIDEHLRSMPTPPPWLSLDPFRHPQENEMLRIGQQPKMHLPHQQNPGGSLQHLPTSRCDARVPSSSDASSSSCSPTTSESLHNALNNILGLDTGGMPQQLKQEPPDDYLSAMHQQMGGAGPFGCSSSAESPQGNSSHRRCRSSAEGMHKCQYCPKKFSTAALLEVHMRDCQLVRVHQCAQCGKRFKARGGLQQHMRIHNNERPYSCHYCTKRFTQKSHVDQHERIHTGAKPFVCQFCGRAFRQRSQQMGHEATHVHSSQEIRPSLESKPLVDIPISSEQRLPIPSNAVTGLLALSQPSHLPPGLMDMPPNPMLHIPDFDHPMLGQMM